MQVPPPGKPFAQKYTVEEMLESTFFSCIKNTHATKKQARSIITCSYSLLLLLLCIIMSPLKTVKPYEIAGIKPENRFLILIPISYKKLAIFSLYRLYLINSPVVRAENLRFKEDGVRDVLKDVFLPWYNAYRFLVQNVLRLHQVELLC